MSIQAAVKALSVGGIIAYPTEAVYGLGCSPRDEAAVMRLLSLKQRSLKKGLILLAGDLEQVEDLLCHLSLEQRDRVVATWPGPITWLLPVTEDMPVWISGGNPSVAVRVTAHPLASELTLAFGGAIVSTSANLAGEEPILTAEGVRSTFGDQVDYVLEGALGGLEKPTEIRDALTGFVVREGS